ncbi:MULTISPECIES: hypothetical protein [Clostridium]|uniref:Uncharacterized protein n=1 Tax=Clostridium frigoriphilum TaxID=443253 RepID=A0ABU7UTJ0_9CLOT|nr:hypothetical protein [Clostridium sp. DSM 17811]MBU3100899.1 hypothetical protein [Clostridium sp. DSM 17811]
MLAEWIMVNSEYAMMVNVMLDKEKNPIISAVRNSIFTKELPSPIYYSPFV